MASQAHRRHPFLAPQSLCVTEASAPRNALAKLSRSSGLRKEPISVPRPSPVTYIEVMPNSSWRLTPKRAQNGLNRCSTTRPAGENLRMESFVRDTVTSSRVRPDRRSEEHTSELQSLMRISYAVFCLKKKKEHKHENHTT